MRSPVVSPAEMRRIEEQAFAGGAAAEGLMEQVGRRVAQAVEQYFPQPGLLEVFYGKGHNGGDALVAARCLREAGWEVALRAQEEDRAKLAELTRRKLGEFEATDSPREFPHRPSPPRTIVLDGLLGLGAAGPLREGIRMLTRRINARREEANACVFAIDLPTGLDGETGEPDADCVVADFTVAAGCAKTGLAADQAAGYVGRLCVAALPEFQAFAPKGGGELATPASLNGLLPRRNFDSHKTQFGRVAIVAGSQGFTGAAVLCSAGALRAGAGLVTVYATPDCQPLIAAAARPEAMVRPVARYEEVLEEKYDVIGLGPGLGHAHAAAILKLIENAECPMVVDADGLTLVAQKGVELLGHCAGPRLLTPHPGEMARLFPAAQGLTRRETAERFVEKFAGADHPVTLLLKGSRTVVYERGRACSYNTTGNPGMGSGGMGDVLTGVCAALIGQHLAPYDAARLGAWLCGRAAEIAASNSEESLAAMDVAAGLGRAFEQVRADTL